MRWVRREGQNLKMARIGNAHEFHPWEHFIIDGVVDGVGYRVVDGDVLIRFDVRGGNLPNVVVRIQLHLVHEGILA